MAQGNQFKGSDRRKHPRKKLITGVTYFVLATPQGVGIARNISEGGLGLFLDRYLPEGTIIKVKFDLPQEEGGSTIEAIGRVVWCKESEGGYLAGIQFLT
jgi:hypothetical protein